MRGRIRTAGVWLPARFLEASGLLNLLWSFYMVLKIIVCILLQQKDVAFK